MATNREFADLHIHSKYSRATSSSMDIPNLVKYGMMKGLNIIGTGDITHPLWRKEVKSEVSEIGEGLYERDGMRFVLSSEISTIYSYRGRIRRVHHLVLFPSFDLVEKFVERAKSYLRSKGKRANFESDGRPILGLSSKELAKLLFSTSERILLIPAHIWTPWFSLFGSKSGFNSMEECYGEYYDRIYALETGLSSDPPMNWRVPDIDNKLLVSNSDCHSPFVNRIGRECTVFRGTISSYDDLYKKVVKKEVEFTVEVDPSYGKYHFDGHRNCNVVMSPKEAKKYDNLCPVCHKPLTLGVLHRVEDLAQRNEGYKPEGAIPFEYHIPLIEIISHLLGKGVSSKSVFDKYSSLVEQYSNEFNMMFNLELDELDKAMKGLGKIVGMLRDKKMVVKPGYDGVYGEPQYTSEVQKSIFDL